jgi:hypothetical protein
MLTMRDAWARAPRGNNKLGTATAKVTDSVRESPRGLRRLPRKGNRRFDLTVRVREREFHVRTRKAVTVEATRGNGGP